jgi:hypothetical protein
MKKLVLVLAVLLCAAPAMATDVTITAVAGPGPNDVTVGFTTSGVTELVRAIALDVQLDDPNVVIGDINCVNAGFGIYPGSISIDASGTVTDWGTCAGAGLDSNLVATEQGSLYVGAANAPAQSGDLFIITLEGCTADGSGDAVVSITEDALRGGVVLEDPDVAANVTLPADVTVTGLPDCVGPGCPCLADIADTTSLGGPDGKVDTGDMAALLTAMILGGDPGDSYNILSPTALMLSCMDLADTTSLGPPDGRVDTGDMAALLTHLILNGNPAANYEAPCM